MSLPLGAALILSHTGMRSEHVQPCTTEADVAGQSRLGARCKEGIGKQLCKANGAGVWFRGCTARTGAHASGRIPCGGAVCRGASWQRTSSRTCTELLLRSHVHPESTEMRLHKRTWREDSAAYHSWNGCHARRDVYEVEPHTGSAGVCCRAATQHPVPHAHPGRRQATPAGGS